MAVSSSTTAVTYTGNGSAVTPYTIPFQFLEAAHIYVGISADGVADPVIQSQSAYVVTQAADRTGSLVTNAAVSSPAKLTIYRVVPFTQPSVFQPQGPFPAKTAETALDRLEMQIQQLNTRVTDLEGTTVVPTGAAGDLEVATWLDSMERGDIKPLRAGQLGVERSTQTVWIAQSTATGDWVEFGARGAGQIVIGVLSDAGLPGVYQTAAATALDEWDVDYALFAGDNNYNGAAAYDSDWAAFLTWINAGVAYPALGNHDVDEAGWQTRLNTKFPYLPGNRRYYRVTLGDGLVDLFVLSSGRDSVFDLVEDDGNDVGSVQHVWFVGQLATSHARWKIAMFHHPPVTLNATDDGTRIEPNMAWPELEQMDLILCGHEHLLEIVRWSGAMIANLSALSYENGSAAALMQGASPGDAWLWADDVHRGLGRLVASQERLTLEVWQAGTAYDPGSRRLLHIRDVRDMRRAPLIREEFTLVAGGTNLPTSSGGDVFIVRLPAATILREVEIATAVADGAYVAFVLKAGIVTLISDQVPISTLAATFANPLVDTILPADTVLTLSWVAGVSRKGMQVNLVMERQS